MKQSKEEKNKKLLLSILSSSMAFYLIVANLLSFKGEIKLQMAKKEYPNQLDDYSTFDDLTEKEQYVFEQLAVDLENVMDDHEYSLKDKGSIDDYYLLTAIYENKNFNDYERENLYKVYEVIKDNKYIDKQEVYARLRTVMVKRENHKKEDRRDKLFTHEDVWVLASYRFNLNQLVFYDYENLADSTILHELMHILFPCNYLSKSFSEGFAELLTLEYFPDEAQAGAETCYFQEIAYVKLLCEIIGSDKVLQIASLNDSELLEEELSQQFCDKKAVKRWMHVEQLNEDNLTNYLSDLVQVVQKNNYSDQKSQKILKLYYQLLFGEENNNEDRYFNIESTKSKVKVFN